MIAQSIIIYSVKHNGELVLQAITIFVNKRIIFNILLIHIWLLTCKNFTFSKHQGVTLPTIKVRLLDHLYTTEPLN